MNTQTLRLASIKRLVKVVSAAALIAGGVATTGQLVGAAEKPATSQLALESCPNFACGQNHNQILL